MKNNKINQKCLEDEESVSESLEQPEFDQIVKGNVEIKKLKSKHKYRITFSKIGNFLVYQVWDKDSKELNDERPVVYQKAKDWVNAFKETNKNLKDEDEELFTPTTIMETEDGKVYAFVIHKADFDSDDRIYFTVSTKEIKVQDKNSSLVKLPCGKFKNMRFDIDSVVLNDNSCCDDKYCDCFDYICDCITYCGCIKKCHGAYVSDCKYYCEIDFMSCGTRPNPKECKCE